MEKISVLVPVYNVEKYLEKCIESILHQSYQNIEVLLVNDGSTDGSEKICIAYAQKDPRIKYFKKENGGLSDARNYGLERALGDYVTFVDSDDYLDENFLLHLYQGLKREKADIAVCGYTRVTEKGEFLKAEPLLTQEKVLFGRAVCEKIFEKEGYRFVVAWNKLYKMDLFKYLRFDVGKLHEDEYISFELLYEVEKVAIVPELLYHYLDRENSIMNSKMTEHRMSCLLEYQMLRISFYEMAEDEELFFLSCRFLLSFLIQFIEKYPDFAKGEHLLHLQKTYRDVFKKMPPSETLGFVKKAYYAIGYLRLSWAVFLKKCLAMRKSDAQ